MASRAFSETVTIGAFPAIVLMWCASCAAGSFVLPQAGSLSFRAGDVQIASLPNLLVDGEFVPNSRYVLTLREPLTRARADSLASRGVTLQGYYPSRSYLVNLDKVSPASLRELDFIESVVEYQNSWKVDPTIGTSAVVTPIRQQIAAEGKVTLRVLLFPGHVLQGNVATQLAAVPGLTVYESESMRDSVSFTAAAPITSLPALAALREVQFIEELPEFTPRDANQRWIVQSNVANSYPLYDHGLSGANQVIGIIDGFLAYQHCSFLDNSQPIGPNHRKILAYNAPLGGYDAHGTHVSAIAAGNSGVEDSSRGIAFDSKIVFNTTPLGTQASYYERFNLHYTQGARVNTNSWGNDATMQYNYACAAIDSFMCDHEDALIVFAVSNSTVVTNPENSKNPIAVTRTNNSPAQNQICSLFGSLPGNGPTLDGRRKPDIAAPGCSIVSATGATGCGSGLNSGTSMAAPAIGGVSALVRQYFTEGFYPTGVATPGDSLTPSGALLKAMIVNTGEDMLPAGYPSHQEGWGRVRAHGSLPFQGDAYRLFINDTRNTSGLALSTDDVREFQVNLADSSQPFRVTMAFTDQPATLPATFASVNDLDLMVVSPAGDIFLGNNLVGGSSAAGGLPDPINNLEHVRIQSPAPGLWTIRVRGTNVNLGTQGFAIVATGSLAATACAGDFNGDQIVDFFDYLDFVAAFSATASGADFNGDQIVDIFDYLDFVTAFNSPC